MNGTRKIVEGRIRTEEGYTGTQRVSVLDDGTRQLEEVVLTRTPSGARCRHVFARKADLQSRVYGLTDLHPYGGWELTAQEETIWQSADE